MAKQSRDQWHRRIKSVEREFQAVRKAVDDFMAALRSGKVTPPPNTEVRDAEAMSRNLERTYLIRLFAAFESGLRSYWAADRTTTPPTKDLINGVAAQIARRGLPSDLQDEVHAVRVYRNSLVHEKDEGTEPVALAVARGRLCTFFAKLPEEWDDR